MKQIPTTWFGPKILKTLAVASQLRLRPGFSSSYAPQGKSQIYLLHGMVWRYIFPSHSHSMFDTQKRCMFDTPKNRKKSEKIYRIQGTADLQPLHVVDPIRWSGLSFRHDLMTLLARFGKPHHPDPKKTAKKGWTLLTLEKLRFLGGPFFELLIFFGSDLDFHPMLSDSFQVSSQLLWWDSWLGWQIRQPTDDDLQPTKPCQGFYHCPGRASGPWVPQFHSPKPNFTAKAKAKESKRARKIPMSNTWQVKRESEKKNWKYLRDLRKKIERRSIFSWSKKPTTCGAPIHKSPSFQQAWPGGGHDQTRSQHRSGQWPPEAPKAPPNVAAANNCDTHLLSQPAWHKSTLILKIRRTRMRDREEYPVECFQVFSIHQIECHQSGEL